MRDGISFLLGVCTKFYRHLRVFSEYCCVYCGRISMIQKGVLSSRLGRFECNEVEGFRKIEHLVCTLGMERMDSTCSR